LLNGFGGLASLLVALGDYAKNYDVIHAITMLRRDPIEGPSLEGGAFTSVSWAELGVSVADPTVWYGLLATGLTVLVGAVTFTGSLMAYGKLQGTKWAPDQPVQFAGQKPAIVALLLGSLALTLLLIAQPTWWPLLLI